MSSKSSKRSAHRSSQETSKGKRFARAFLAFILFLVLTALSFSVCAKVTFVSPGKVADIFANHDYVSALTDDALGYAHDVCSASMLPEDTLDSVITYERIAEIQKAYGYGVYAAAEDYSDTAYIDLIDGLKKDIVSGLNSAVKQQKLSVSADVGNGAAAAAQKITKYITSITEFRYSEAVRGIVNIGKNATLIAIIGFAFLAVILSLIIISIGSVRYRAMRMLVHALNATGLFNLLAIAGVKLVEHFKTLYIFPMYLRESVLRHIDSCLYTVGFSSAVCFLLALILASIIWKLNRDKNA